MVTGINSALALAIINDLRSATKQVGTSLRRLSSGKRLMQLGDGTAAEFSTAAKLNAQTRGLRQALLNVNSVQGLTSTANTALDQMMTLAYKLRELAQKAQDESLTSTERDLIEEEASGIVEDMTNIASDTTYRDAWGENRYLLDNSFGSMKVQVGPNVRNTFSFSIGDARTSTLGKLAIYSGSQGAITTAITGNLIINGTSIEPSIDDGVSTASANSSALAILTAINTNSGTTGVYAESVGTIRTITTDFSGAASFTGTFSSSDFVINGVSITGAISTASLLTSAINANTSSTGVVATLSGSNITLTAADGRNIAISIASANARNVYDVFNLSANSSVFSNYATMSAAATSRTWVGAVRLWSSSAITISGTSPSLTIGISSGTKSLVSGTDLASVDLSSTTNADQALKVLDATIAQISTLRSQVDAVHSRLDFTSSYLLDQQDSVDSTLSSLQDVDFVMETTRLVMAQLLQDASVASLTQANVSRERVMSLLTNL